MLESNKELIEVLVRVVELVLIPILWKVYTVLSTLSSEVQTLKIILVGSDGKNGIRSRVRRLEVRQERMALMMAAQAGETNLSFDSEDTDE